MNWAAFIGASVLTGACLSWAGMPAGFVHTWSSLAGGVLAGVLLRDAAS